MEALLSLTLSGSALTLLLLLLKKLLGGRLSSTVYYYAWLLVLLRFLLPLPKQRAFAPDRPPAAGGDASPAGNNGGPGLCAPLRAAGPGSRCRGSGSPACRAKPLPLPRNRT